MFLFLLSIILLIAAIVAISYGFAQKENVPKVGGLALILVAIAIFICSCIGIVPTGYTGILTTFGAVQDRTVSAGINFIAPWQNVVTMDNRTQKVNVTTQAFSSDIQQVDITLSVNYSIGQETARELYKTVGKNYYDNVMFPRIQENVKAVFSQYTAEALISNREILSTAVAELMKHDMEQYAITIISIAIEDIDFTDAFTNAVEAKQVAAQNKLTAETQQAQKTMEQQAEAERAIIAANAKAEQDVIAAKADLEVVKIQADAALYAGEREANMNERIAAALSPELIQYYWIKQWNGKLPSTVLGSQSNYMLDISDVVD